VADIFQTNARCTTVLVDFASLRLTGGAVGGLLVILGAGLSAALPERTILVGAAGFAALTDALAGARPAKLVLRTGVVGADTAAGPALSGVGAVIRCGALGVIVAWAGDTLAADRVALLGG
jgi:hypothetical protein